MFFAIFVVCIFLHYFGYFLVQKRTIKQNEERKRRDTESELMLFSYDFKCIRARNTKVNEHKGIVLFGLCVPVVII